MALQPQTNQPGNRQRTVSPLENDLDDTTNNSFNDPTPNSYRDTPTSNGSSAMIIYVLLALAVIVAGYYIYSGMSGAPMTKPSATTSQMQNSAPATGSGTTTGSGNTMAPATPPASTMAPAAPATTPQ